MPHRPPRLDPRKHLLGFGPVGWIAAAGLAILLQAVVRGVDVRYHILATVERIFGIDAVYWIVSHALPWHHFTIGDGRFGLIAMCYWLVALKIYPERKSLFWALLLLMWGLAAPMLPQEVVGFLARRSSDPTAFFGPANFAKWSMRIIVASELVSVALLVAMTRSRLVAAAALAGLLVSVLIIGTAMRWQPLAGLTPLWFTRLDPWLWHALMGGAAMTWAISARRRAIGPHQCRSCGYDRRGLAPGAPCPECASPPSPPPESEAAAQTPPHSGQTISAAAAAPARS